MPKFLVPKKTGSHRVAGKSRYGCLMCYSDLTQSAAIALYRALLSQCDVTPLETSPKHALINTIRNRFRQNVRLQSLRRLKQEFGRGYEVSCLLRALRSRA